MTALYAPQRQPRIHGPTMIVSRFAPSPTGRLHLGHVWSAVQAHDLARAANGRFLLRIEDLDPTRSRAAHINSIIDDLTWLGLTWDGPVWRQSGRADHYHAALDQLRAMGLIYPCFCSRADIAAALGAPHGPLGNIYPGICRDLAPSQVRRRIEDEPHCWRLDHRRALLSTGPIWWDDAMVGQVAVDMALLGDVVLARKDAPAAYHLAVTVDDAAQGVTDIVRGVDLFHATHVHRLLQSLLGLNVPRYHHHPLLVGPDGARLAKRAGAPSLDGLRAQGVDPVDLVGNIRERRFPIGIAIAPA